ncbi:MAG: hypothetical protein AVDCRST_MAG08-1662 [uncultured Acetobacteraceae bacterium]|uniref:Uncharacterized protein n=1 Tax=uncultured Acetobacteraceae bacterium TaxID=169975 RepID=A0A6J4I5P7_9PROT|nr:MAG: hypothetical protein AVDCRST_MAG08-1662 [uncultured Acetobacteraceae bacterium]
MARPLVVNSGGACRRMIADSVHAERPRSRKPRAGASDTAGGEGDRRGPGNSRDR